MNSFTHTAPVANTSFSEISDTVIFHNRTKRPIMKFGLSVQLWVQNAWHIDARKEALDLAKTYFEYFKHDLTLYKPNGSATYRPIENLTFPSYYERSVSELSSDDAFSLWLNKEKNGPSDLEFLFLGIDISRKEKAPLTYIQIYFPGLWVKHNLEALDEFFIQICNLNNLHSGVSGWSPIFENGISRPEVVFPYLRRFPGLDLPNGSWGLDSGNSNKIRGTNWVTFLNKKLFDSVTTIAELNDALTPKGELIVGNNSIAVKACGEPLLGDHNRGIWPDPYNTVGKAFSSIRFRSYDLSYPYFKVPKGSPLDSNIESTSWLERFESR